MKEKLLLTYYLQQDRLIRLTEIARDFRISQRKAQMLIQDFNYFSRKTGCLLKARTNLGYELIVQDAIKMKCFIEEPATHVSYLNPNHRRLLTQIYLVSQNDYVSSRQLGEYLGTSKSTITADLKALAPKMAAFQLEIIGKTYYGLTVTGSELNKRLCLIKALNLLPVMTLQAELVDYQIPVDFQREVRKLFSKHQINLTEKVFLTIVQYMIVMKKRLVAGQRLTYFPKDQKQPLTSLEKSLKDFLEQWYQIDLPEVEVSYIIDYIGDQLISYQIEDVAYERLTRQALSKVSEKLGLAVKSKDSFYQNLSKHLLNLSKRLTYGTQILFPHRKDYYHSHFFEIYLTQVFLAELRADLPLESITIDEVLYVSLYFKAWLIEGGDCFDIYRKKIVVMAESRSGGYLLKEQLAHYYPQMAVTIADDIDLSVISHHMTDYDLVMTSKEISQLEQQANPGLIQITDYLSPKEQEGIAKSLKRLFEWPAVATLLEDSNYRLNQAHNNQEWQQKGTLLLVEPLFALDLNLVTERTPSELVIEQFSQPVLLTNKKVSFLLSLSYEKNQLKVVKNFCEALENITKNSLLKGELLSCQGLKEFTEVMKNGYLGR